MSLANESKRLRVLVVDDDRNCRELLGLILKEMGCDVTSASSGYEALQEIIKSPFDLVFTDLSMTVMDGWRLAQNIRKFNRTVPIVLVTAAEKTEIIKKIISSSIDAVLFKPFSMDEIEEIMRKKLPMQEMAHKRLPACRST